MNERILTIPEVASYLQLSRAKVYWLVSRKEIPHIRIGRNVRIKETELAEWLNQQSVRPETTFD